MSINIIVTEVYLGCKNGAKGAKVSLVIDLEVQKVKRKLRNAPVLNQFIFQSYSTLNKKGAKVYKSLPNEKYS